MSVRSKLVRKATRKLAKGAAKEVRAIVERDHAAKATPRPAHVTKGNAPSVPMSDVLDALERIKNLPPSTRWRIDRMRKALARGAHQ